ncbi:MAG: glucose-6-phosphate dehydrogenase, partial [Acidimicrobiia bacterium]|nr:glucose-6-phosphate dehydrogenase [Acidimicrobiia bacterium]
MSVESPLHEPTLERVAPPAVLVVFGASGDLTSRKLMPAIERLALRHLLPGGFSVVGVGRTPMGDDEFRERMRTLVSEGGGGGDEANHVWD